MAHPLSSPLLAVLAIAATLSVAAAQEATPRHRTHGREHRAEVTAAGAPVTYRGLTINRGADVGPGLDEDQDIYRDGPVRYNDVRDYSPAPYTTSGVQFPFGLDGIGGYGSDLDVSAGQDSAIYDRGAGLQP